MSEAASNSSTGPETDPEFDIIPAWEYKRVLKVAGYSYPEFARGIGMSRSYVAGIANGLRPIRIRQIQQLCNFLGPRLYKAALQKVRRDHEEFLKRNRESNERHRLFEEQQRRAEAERIRVDRETRAQKIEAELDGHSES